MKFNGALVQSLEKPTNFIKRFNYLGINAYHQDPLIVYNEHECRELTNEQQMVHALQSPILCSEFISNADLLNRYLKKCKELGIDTRVLFVESDYCHELWKDDLPQMIFLGFEYCAIPIDEQIITDIDWYPEFFKYHKMLNEYGLFNTYQEAKEFSLEYAQECLLNHIGDGEIDSYICKVHLQI
ncbi:MAG: hypothetical protein IKJ59_02865 [Clostridia bacterium]|nr:hypothetical protein [Clostridia bacterium]